MYLVNAMGILRVSREGEMQGLDLHEHGISAYPEYVISGIVSPAATVIGGPHPVPRPIGVAKPAIRPAG
jgi:Amt family ammonium transporter